MRRFGIILLVFLLAVIMFGTPAFAAVCTTNPTPGETQCTFWAYDYGLIDPQEIELEAECRKVTDHLLVFVQTSLLGQITDNRIDTIAAAFESDTPNDELGGIYQQATATFGPPPDPFDDWRNDAKIYLVIQNIPSTSLNPVKAYFRAKDLETTQFGEPMENSNEHAVLFLHHDQLESDERLSDLSARFVDLIHWNLDPEEVAWVKDVAGRSFALSAGYENYKFAINDFAEDPDFPLIGKDQGNRVELDHGATTLFGMYLNDIFGPYFIASWIQDPLEGVAGFENTLVLSGDPSGNFCDYLHDWVIRNGVNRGEYKYSNYELPYFNKPIIRIHPGQSTPVLPAYAGSYVEIDASMVTPQEDLQVTFDISDTLGVRVTAVMFANARPNELIVEELTVMAGQPSVFLFENAGVSFDTLTLITSRCTEADPMPYSIKTEILEPEVDGDEDLDEDVIEYERELEPEPEPEDEPEEEAEPDLGPLITGDYTCPDINTCYRDCNSDACRNACISQGTSMAQDEWDKYRQCITGFNPDGVDCLGLTNADERETCMIRNCHIEFETCRIIEEPPVEDDGVGGSSCTVTGSGIGAAAMFILLGLLAISRRRHA